MVPTKKRRKENRVAKENRNHFVSTNPHSIKRTNIGRKVKLTNRNKLVHSPSPEKRSRLTLALVEINRKLASQMMIWQAINSFSSAELNL